ncbi:hypothetical protein T05_1325 [Trichinella murrelli]|uniref:Uncharacterized protein n=1 Tax=Trichinella murrelli TaxID=144512 RepID=A0A0V0UG62_9BILA|nr:hypothetical protein T05_1325 [Trichinella murrelli]
MLFSRQFIAFYSYTHIKNRYYFIDEFDVLIFRKWKVKLNGIGSVWPSKISSRKHCYHYIVRLEMQKKGENVM